MRFKLVQIIETGEIVIAYRYSVTEKLCITLTDKGLSMWGGYNIEYIPASSQTLSWVKSLELELISIYMFENAQ